MNLTLVILSLAVRVFGELETKQGSPGAKVLWFFAHVLAVTVFFLGGLGVLLASVWMVVGLPEHEWSSWSAVVMGCSVLSVTLGHHGQRWAEGLLER